MLMRVLPMWQFSIYYYTILYYTILYYTILYYTILYYTDESSADVAVFNPILETVPFRLRALTV